MGLRAIFYDTETTGIRAADDQIIEIAAYDPVSDRSFVSLVRPGRLIPAEATAVHGITDAMVAEAPDFGIVSEQFTAFCGEDAMLIAHNNDAFDLHFLRAEFGRVGKELPPWKFFDTLKWARRYRRDLPRHSLQFLREIFGIPANTAHRALDDVLVLHRVYAAMVDDLTPDQVWDLIYGQGAKADVITHMPFGKHQGQPLAKVPKSYVKWLFQDGAFDKPDNAALKAGFQQLGMLPV